MVLARFGQLPPLAAAAPTKPAAGPPPPGPPATAAAPLDPACAEAAAGPGRGPAPAPATTAPAPAPAVRQVNSIDGHRIMTLLQEQQARFELVARLPGPADRRVASVFGAETLACLAQLHAREAAYEALRAELPPTAPRCVDAAAQLHQATLALCRHFKEHPHAARKLAYLNLAVSPAMEEMERCHATMKALIQTQLSTSYEDDRQRQKQLTGIIAKERKRAEEIKALTEQLVLAQNQRDSELHQQDTTIRALKEELKTMTARNEETTKRLMMRSKHKEDADQHLSSETETAIQNDIRTLSSELQQLLVAHRSAEAHQRKKKFKVEEEVDNWIHNYDQDMQEKQADYDEIHSLYQDEKTQLDELSRHHDALQAEWAVIEVERQAAEAQRKRVEAEQARLHKAATQIQAAWRGYATRKKLRLKAVERKKGSGKSSGKKGAKKA
ncbi:hypothetical protein CXG81DRAFT_27006 [Caulochytrium protostelioides]|uniref:Dynein regulatory complex protein 10 n=1 Tax=Caulochytrium protostelioides TaxID=1555241 RepID=A0A4P9X5B9_9FUNG|nr:hypothetical protein CXG81DRAFT_27006 [Caulochytrium protostelioides]|eukprot:RKP00282.1 hypothetical protein CXG81DRAFT_27006 [Caulochytrium protostelioides]